MQNHHELLCKVVNTLGLNCSIITAKRTLYDAGIHSYVTAKKPFVSLLLVLVGVKNIKKNHLIIENKLSSLMSQVLRLESSQDK